MLLLPIIILCTTLHHFLSISLDEHILTVRLEWNETAVGTKVKQYQVEKSRVATRGGEAVGRRRD